MTRLRMKVYRKWTSIIGAASLFLFLSGEVTGSEVAGGSDALEIEGAIKRVLEIQHPLDNSEWWRSLGPTAPHVILGMLKKSEDPYEKIRLVEALGWFDDREAVTFLKKEAENPAASGIRSAAMRALIVSQGMREKEFISRMLNHVSPKVRVETAKALQRLETAEAHEMVEQFLASEKDEGVVRQVQVHKKLRTAIHEERRDDSKEQRQRSGKNGGQGSRKAALRRQQSSTSDSNESESPRVAKPIRKIPRY